MANKIPVLQLIKYQVEVYNQIRHNCYSVNGRNYPIEKNVEASKYYNDYTPYITIEENPKSAESISINIFTDGSKSPLGVGAAAVLFRNDNEEYKRYKLANWYSVYQAELLAISKARSC